MILTTDAIVLRTMKYRDTSRIATLYTRAAGKLSVISKGDRERATRFGGSLDVLSYITAIIYRHEHRDLQLLSRCELKQPFRRLAEDMERMASAMVVVELLDAVTHAEEENPGLFALLAGTLEAIDAAPRNVMSCLFYFELHLLAVLGFRPNLTTCFNCGLPLIEGDSGPATFALNIAAGGAYCELCTVHGLGFETVSAGTLRTLQHLQTLADPHDAPRVAMSPQVRGEVAGMLRRLLQAHVEGLRPLKSEAVFASLL